MIDCMTQSPHYFDKPFKERVRLRAGHIRHYCVRVRKRLYLLSHVLYARARHLHAFLLTLLLKLRMRAFPSPGRKVSASSLLYSACALRGRRRKWLVTIVPLEWRKLVRRRTRSCRNPLSLPSSALAHRGCPCSHLRMSERSFHTQYRERSVRE